MRALSHSNPHLRLTAAILVAMLAALAGGLDVASGERQAQAQGERARRSEIVVGGLRLVACDDHAPQLHLVAGLRAVRFHEAVAPTADDAASGCAPARAERRARLDASRASGASLLRTTVLPPPAAC